MISLGWGCRVRLLPAGLRARLAWISASLCLASLVACSGGGGGGSGATILKTNPNANFLDQLSEPSSPALASDWSGSQEYVNSTGLDQLNAAEGYARRSGGLAGGQGVRIAIIDSGIDVTHPDLGNLASTSWSAGGEDLVGNSHATFVAGIAGASRTQSSDPNDMHGMAYRATLVNFQAARPSETAANGFVSFSTGDLVNAIHAAAGLSSDDLAVESDIMNLSLGATSNSSSTFAGLRSAMRTAASEDKIMVLAAGNEGLSSDPDDRLQPIYPAAYADDAGIAGLAIVVGNLTSSNTAAASSNFCGDTKNYCLFAPGSSIRSTLNGGNYGIGSGTSFAAPYVAGAAAVVKAAFPGVSSEDVVDRLLLTAADLGDPGVDTTFGRGLLDLEAAMAPVGPTGFPLGPTVDGPRASLSGSGLRLAAGFSMDEAGARHLRRAVSFDDMGFPFPVDLGRAVTVAKRDHGLAAFVSGETRSIAMGGASHVRIAALVADGETVEMTDVPSATSFDQQERDILSTTFRFEADVTDEAQIFASLNGGDGPKLGLGTGLIERGGTSLQRSAFFSPHDMTAQESASVGVSFRPAEGMTMAFSTSSTMPKAGGAATSLQRAEILQTLPANIDLRLEAGLVQEDGSFAGGRSSGAFGDDRTARSQFLTISLLGPISDDIDWFASYSLGQASIGEGAQADIVDWSGTRSEAFGAGLIVRDVARDGDGLTVMVGQPLRQDEAKATIDLPIARQPDGQVVTATETIDFAPDAREIVTEIGYRLPIDPGGDHDLEATGFLRLNPDHDQRRDPDVGLGVSYRWRF